MNGKEKKTKPLIQKDVEFHKQQSLTTLTTMNRRNNKSRTIMYSEVEKYQTTLKRTLQCLCYKKQYLLIKGI